MEFLLDRVHFPSYPCPIFLLSSIINTFLTDNCIENKSKCDFVLTLYIEISRRRNRVDVVRCIAYINSSVLSLNIVNSKGLTVLTENDVVKALIN